MVLSSNVIGQIFLSEFKGEKALYIQDCILVNEIENIIRNGEKPVNKIGFTITPENSLFIERNGKLQKYGFFCYNNDECYFLDGSYRISIKENLYLRLNNYVQNLNNNANYKHQIYKTSVRHVTSIYKILYRNKSFAHVFFKGPDDIFLFVWEPTLNNNWKIRFLKPIDFMKTIIRFEDRMEMPGIK